MIPSIILSPQGCGKVSYISGPVFCKSDDLCSQCEKIRQAQIQILIDEKKDEIEFLEVTFQMLDAEEFNDIGNRIDNKIFVIQQEIKTLEGLRE